MQALEAQDAVSLAAQLRARWSRTQGEVDFPQAAHVAHVLLETPAQSLPSPYCTLKLGSLLVTKAKIQKTYHKAALDIHPDRNRADSPAEATRKTRQLHEARSSLFDRNERDHLIQTFLGARL